jgi:hypothetical protein
VPLLVLATGCTKLFNIQPIDPPTGDGGLDGSANTCISDDFGGGVNAALYSVIQPAGGSTAASNGKVVISWPSMVSGNNYGGIDTANPFDLRGGDATVEIDAFTGDTANGELDVILDSAHIYVVTVGLSQVEFDLYDGDPTSYTVVGSTGYSTLPLTLRVAHDLAADSITYSVMGSAGNPFTKTIPKPFTVQNVDVGFAGGTYGSASAVGHATFDNLVLRSPSCL